jgi:hypothetical protein
MMRAVSGGMALLSEVLDWMSFWIFGLNCLVLVDIVKKYHR